MLIRYRVENPLGPARPSDIIRLEVNKGRKLEMNIFQEWWRHIARGAARGALHAFLGKQVEVEKRDAPEDENLDAREEVKIKVSVFSVIYISLVINLRSSLIYYLLLQICLFRCARNANFTRIRITSLKPQGLQRS